MQSSYSAFGLLTIKISKDENTKKIIGWLRDLESRHELGINYKKVKRVEPGEYVMPLAWYIERDEQYFLQLNKVFSSCTFGTNEAKDMEFSLSFRYWDEDCCIQYFKGEADFISKKGTTTLTGYASENRDDNATVNSMALHLGGLDNAAVAFMEKDSLLEPYYDSFYYLRFDNFTNAPETEIAFNEVKKYQKKYNAALLAIEPNYFSLPERTREEFQKKYAIVKEVQKTMEDADDYTKKHVDVLVNKLLTPYQNIFNLKKRNPKTFH